MITTASNKLVIAMHPKDNVLVALSNLAMGQVVEHEGHVYHIVEPIQSKHKFYTEDLVKGSSVYMYGVLVGTTQQDVVKGSLVSTSNLHHAAEPYAYRATKFHWEKPMVADFAHKTFNGFFVLFQDKADGYSLNKSNWRLRKSFAKYCKSC
jgi:altronate hydrolase